MTELRLPQKLLSFAWIVSLGLQTTIAHPARAGELRPSVPPGGGRVGPSLQQHAIPRETPGAYYERFADQVARLNRQQKTALASGLQKKLQQALDRRDYAAVSHYSRLLRITEQR